MNMVVKKLKQGAPSGRAFGENVSRIAAGKVPDSPYEVRPMSLMPKGASQSPKGDLGEYRQMEADKVGTFKKGGSIVAASKRFKSMGKLKIG